MTVMRLRGPLALNFPSLPSKVYQALSIARTKAQLSALVDELNCLSLSLFRAIGSSIKGLIYQKHESCCCRSFSNAIQ